VAVAVLQYALHIKCLRLVVGGRMVIGLLRDGVVDDVLSLLGAACLSSRSLVLLVCMLRLRMFVVASPSLRVYARRLHVYGVHVYHVHVRRLHCMRPCLCKHAGTVFNATTADPHLSRPAPLFPEQNR
jgi:hypothetical protein